jgi:hypothetical protein
MSAAEFVAFWGERRMCSISTVSAGGNVHVAPLDVELRDGRFYIATFPDAVRLRDHRANPRCALATWDDAYHAAIVHGTASEASQAGQMVTVCVDPTRIHAIRAPAGHHAARAR